MVFMIDCQNQRWDVCSRIIAFRISSAIKQQFGSLVVATTYSPVDGLTVDRNLFYVCAFRNEVADYLGVVMVSCDVQTGYFSVFGLVRWEFSWFDEVLDDIEMAVLDRGKVRIASFFIFYSVI